MLRGRDADAGRGRDAVLAGRGAARRQHERHDRREHGQQGTGRRAHPGPPAVRSPAHTPSTLLKHTRALPQHGLQHTHAQSTPRAHPGPPAARPQHTPGAYPEHTRALLDLFLNLVILLSYPLNFFIWKENSTCSRRDAAHRVAC